MESKLRAAIDDLGRGTGVPAPLVEEILHRLRPSVRLCPDVPGQDENAPPAARLGGLPRMPEDMAWPDGGEPHIATIDCAVLPRDVLDIELPEDGHLLVFADIVDADGSAAVRYVPAGSETVERGPRITNEDGYSWDVTVYEPAPLYAVVVPSFDDDWETLPLAREFMERFPSGSRTLEDFTSGLDALLDTSRFASIRIGGHSRYFQIPPEEDGLTHFLSVFGDPICGSPFDVALAGTPEDMAARRYEELQIYLGG
ncbi:DUF1963 domain-containing protein [Streptomyces sp. NPDC020731]|uniref:DUF1963 domain-containing protein n=1 Tax=Streptomyces sp. NPDC020731 TaxID=3365085 RepID=UPI0037962AA6